MEITADVTYYQEPEGVLSRLIKRLVTNPSIKPKTASNKFGFIQIAKDSVASTNESDVISQFANKAKFLSFRRKLLGFVELKEGWDSYDARPPKFITIARAVIVLDHLFKQELLPNDVCPSVEGGTSIYFSNGDKYADFEFFNNGEILAGMSDRVNEPIVKEVDLSDIESVIEEIRQFLND